MERWLKPSDTREMRAYQFDRRHLPPHQPAKHVGRGLKRDI
jgi:hypothetical protein